MESPNKRFKPAPHSSFDHQDDFVPLGGDESSASYSARQVSPTSRHNVPRPSYRESDAHRGPPQTKSDRYSDRRGDHDRPKSKHILPGHEPWILVKTKLGRRFVHNPQTHASLWRVPRDVLPGVREFERLEQEQKEKAANAKWAEEQLSQMRKQSKASVVNEAADAEGRRRRRRSESLQREDEAALMAELAAQAEHAEEQDVKEVVQTLERPNGSSGQAYDSDSSYEEVEVTDSEGEDDYDQPRGSAHGYPPNAPAEDAPIEFGEDDIAYQLGDMEDQYDFDSGEYGDEQQEDWEEGAGTLALGVEDAVNLFRDMLDDHRVSPFTPWEQIIADESETGILNDDRYTVFSNMRARKEAWDAWVRDKAAQIKEQRATMEKLDPKIPYLAFLHSKATPTLYWPEFKRKFKREAELNDRKLSDKDREKLYRDHIARLKLPEPTRKADLHTLLERIPIKALNRDTGIDSLPQQLISHLHYISLTPSVRDAIIESHLRTLPPAPDGDDLTAEEHTQAQKKREERVRREQAMANRERQVEEEKRRVEKATAHAKRELREEQRELREAMAVGNPRLNE